VDALNPGDWFRPQMPSVGNLRVHVYGTQGSGSIFPSREERLAFQRQSDQDLLKLVFEDLAASAGADGRIGRTVEEILGGPLDQRTLARYAARFSVPEPRVYGGWTTCIRIETADEIDIVFDCGSGFRPCARDLQSKWGTRGERHLHLFGSHSHLDHTEGFDQAAVCFDPRNRLHIYGNHQFLRALDFNLGIFSRQVAPAVQGVQTPIFFGVMPARFEALAIGPAPADDDGPSLNAQPLAIESPIALGATRVTPFEVHHPAPCLAYRVERAGRVMVFCTDHELRHGDEASAAHQASLDAEARLVRQATGADLLYRDGQYLRAEYDGVKGIGGSGPVPRLGWGHSCLEDIIEMATRSGVRHTLVGHHDPNRDWSERNWLDESMARRSAGSGPRFELARAEMVIDL
jgi:phosphoribosyl 1,2-cyclic phosphodiesterase